MNNEQVKRQNGSITLFKKLFLVFLAMTALILLSTTSFGLVRDQQMTFPNSSDIITSSDGGVVEFRVEVNGSMYSENTAAPAVTGLNLSNVTVTIGSLSCANSTNVDNASMSTWICDIEVSSLEDITTLTATATIYNGTSAGGFVARNTTTSTTVRIDNTVPEVSIITAANTIFDLDTATLTGNAVNSSSCQFRFGSNIIAGTVASDVCTVVISTNNPPDGDYQVSMRADDGLNESVTGNTAFSVKFSGGSGGGVIPTETVVEAAIQRVKGNEAFFILLLAVLAYLFIIRKK